MISALLATAHAVGIGLSVMEVELEAAPGGAFAETVLVRNDSDQPVQVRGALSDWWFREGGHRFDPVGTRERSAAIWSSLSTTELVLQPGESKPVEVQGTVPPDVDPGGYYGAIFFSTVPADGKGAVVRMGTLYSVVVGKTPTPELTCGIPTVVDVRGQLQTRLPCTLQGERHGRYVLNAVLRDRSSRVVARGKSTETRLLPGQTRDLTFDIPAVEAGSYKLDGLVRGDDTSMRISTAVAVRDGDAGTL